MRESIKGRELPVKTGSAFTGNIPPLLHELRHALQQLAKTGEEHAIDLGTLPLAPGEARRFEQMLGRGEILAKVNALGTSEIEETAIPGIWRVTHYNREADVISRFIEVTRCPAILCSPTEELATGVDKLRDLIKTAE